MFALPDEDVAEAAAASATHRISAIHLRAAQAFVNTAGLNNLRELDPLPAFDGTPDSWGQFAQDWHEVKDLHLLGVPPAMHPRVLMRCLPAGLRKNVAGWARDDPTMSLDRWLLPLGAARASTPYPRCRNEEVKRANRHGRRRNLLTKISIFFFRTTANTSAPAAP